MSNYIAELCQFADGGVSPYHSVAQAAEYLENHGFSALALGGEFCVQRGGRYYVKDGTFLAAIAVGEENFFRVAASHTDWPCLRIKPQPELSAGGCRKLRVEPYGGAILNTWLDRPLSLAGVVMLRSEHPMKPALHTISWDTPLMTIPNLAIHMNREVNKGVAIKANVDLLPICGNTSDEADFLLGKIAEKRNVAKEDILSYELYAYCMEQAKRVGFDAELLSSPRLDNLSSVHATLYGLTRAKAKGINIAVLYDNEEIGSNTRRGGDSTTLTLILEKLCLALGLSRTDFLNACVNGMMLSCDAAHAAHPNHMEFADGPCAPVLNGGVALKRSPRYSSDAETCAVVQGLCEANGIAVQTYMNRADLPGGSTVGSMASSLLAMPSADVGVPLLAMHSACELMGANDQEALCRLCEAFYQA